MKVTYLHLAIEDMEGVATVGICDDGYVRFNDNTVDYSIDDLKEIIAAAEYELDNAMEDRLDCDDDEWFEDEYRDQEDDVDDWHQW